MRQSIINIEQEQKNKNPNSLTKNGVLETLEHFASYASEKGGMVQIWRISI
jgi:hypothetical protein